MKLRLLALVGCALLATTQLTSCGSVAPQSSKGFVVHSREYLGNPLWRGLDATITETRQDDRISELSVIERMGYRSSAAGSRFLWCGAIWLAEERGFSWLKISAPIDYVQSPGSQDRDMEYFVAVLLLRERDENADAILGDRKRRYKPFTDLPLRDFASAGCGKK